MIHPHTLGHEGKPPNDGTEQEQQIGFQVAVLHLLIPETVLVTAVPDGGHTALPFQLDIANGGQQRHFVGLPEVKRFAAGGDAQMGVAVYQTRQERLMWKRQNGCIRR